MPFESNSEPFELSSGSRLNLAVLNPAQREAVETIEGPLLILAGPGSGKTRVITHRVAHMLEQGIPAHNIAALTFTNKAAGEMRDRLALLAPGQQVWSGTFHRFCSRLLRAYAGLVGLTENFTIYDTSDSKKLLKQAIEAAEVDLRHYSPDSLGQAISNLKSQGIGHDQFTPPVGNPLLHLAARVYPHYQRLLQSANGVDFDDLLLYAVQLLRENPELREQLDRRYAYMLVDEYQDTNRVQYQLIRLLNHTLQNLAVTGDPDQSIYGWRGANINNILDFEKDYRGVKVVRLEQNYRSTKSILAVADQLISNNTRRKAKQLLTDNAEGEPVSLVAYPDPQFEARDIAESIAVAIRSGKRRPRDFAIFYRTNALSRSVETSLRNAGIPYQIVQGLEFYQRREIKDLIAYLHLLNNERDAVAFERVINVPARKIGDKTVEKLRTYAHSKKLSLLGAARVAGLVESISKSVAAKISQFVALFDRIGEARDRDVGEIIRRVLTETKYREWLVEDGSEEGYERAANVDELVSACDEFDLQHPNDGGLEAFLEQAALVNDTDAWESDSDFVTLLTIHSSKGLEFPVVYIVGLEDGLIPHERSSTNDEELEEERRLLFVGITRAEQQLQLSRCLSRYRRNGVWPCIASRFLMELPREIMNCFEPAKSDPWADQGDGFEPDLESVDPWLEDGFSSDEVKEPTPRLKASGTASFPRVVTAAELEKKQEEMNAIRLHPDRFQLGMPVEHPEYGIGQIVELSGSGMKRVATVEFTPLGKRRFRLSHSNLQPANPDSH